MYQKVGPNDMFVRASTGDGKELALTCEIRVMVGRMAIRRISDWKIVWGGRTGQTEDEARASIHSYDKQEEAKKNARDGESAEGAAVPSSQQ